MYKIKYHVIFFVIQMIGFVQGACAADKARRRSTDSNSSVLIACHRKPAWNAAVPVRFNSPYNQDLSVEQLRNAKEKVQSALRDKELDAWCMVPVSCVCCTVKRRNICCLDSLCTAGVHGTLSGFGCLKCIELFEQAAEIAVPESNAIVTGCSLLAGFYACYKTLSGYWPDTTQERKELRELEALLQMKKND